MLSDFLQDRAAMYVSGELAAPERAQFEILLEFHDELRGFVKEVSEVGAGLAVSALRRIEEPSPEVKVRIAEAIVGRPQQRSSEALVVSSPEGKVEWVNAAFTEMCGYSLEELRGKRLGPILQGVDTDPATAERLRESVRAKRACRETILNYHRSGTPYWVDIEISPVIDDTGTALWLVAREREVRDAAAA